MCEVNFVKFVIIRLQYNGSPQDFVKKMSDGVKVWIGLTDSDVEDTWKWVDDTYLTSK